MAEEAEEVEGAEEVEVAAEVAGAVADCGGGGFGGLRLSGLGCDADGTSWTSSTRNWAPRT